MDYLELFLNLRTLLCMVATEPVNVDVPTNREICHIGSKKFICISDATKRERLEMVRKTYEGVSIVKRNYYEYSGYDFF